MTFIKSIEIKDFTYILPDDKIAKYPLKQRDESKLLIYKDGKISQSQFKNCIEFLPENSLLVFNNTKVIQARLHFQKNTGANIEIFCLEPHFPSEFEMIFASVGKCSWKCLVGNLKKWKSGDLEKEIVVNGQRTILKTRKSENFADNQVVEFEWNNNFSFSEILESIGEIPIPPYLNRNSEQSDLTTYQTVYSKIKGSVAAPTAGLHFTENVLNQFIEKKITKAEITLHVGAGTFKPVKSVQISDHEMHTEHFFISADVIEKLLENIGNITAVGTTTVRTLESIYWLGVKMLHSEKNEFENHISQWENYDLPQNISVEKSLKMLLNYLKNNKQNLISASTQIIIAPGYKFRLIDRMFTNFHQPQSTLLLLVGAFVGKDWLKIYNYALENDFRFLSYGDSNLLFKNQ